ncbi:uncharacterized protein BX663DRAFT_556558 [Cokeromyces recurvatus]|uniref:uncharacterized protein n=1 Tax=Cokeromyces recurvatus TaxID=90255 RepID=UPI00221FB01E|nr:uncharacterized protein BX663DRAFT_556558 [Cokeromyces recurvatus]KAI7897604.1 hypothetical protein BX663DRAFT_556558 [Cokeromyces recurvatus]
MDASPTTADNDDQQQQRLIQRQQLNRSSFYMLLFLFSLLFFNFSDDNSNVRVGKPTKGELIEDLENEKSLLNNLTFGENITYPIPNTVKGPLKELWSIGQQPETSYYHNITGIFRGEWINRNISIPQSTNITEVNKARNNYSFEGPGSWTFNVKAVKTIDHDMNYIEGYFRFKDAEKSDYGALLLAGGVHYLTNGTLYLMVVPDRYPLPLDELLHMLPSNDTFIIARNVINEQIDKRIEELKEERYWDWQSIDDGDHSEDLPFTCSFQMFGQLTPSTTTKESDLLDYEKELENPQGISTINPPLLLLSSEMYSPNCQLLLSTSNSKGIKIENYYSKAMTYASIASLIAIIQIFTLIDQMEFTPTPSSVSNVSYWTIAMQAVMDGYLCLLHLTTGVVIENVFIPFATAAFFTFILVSIFGMRYLLVVWRIQRPESIRPPSPDDTVRRPPTEESQNPQRDITFLYYRLYAVLLLGLFLFYQSVTRSAFVQNMIVGTLGLAFYSFWIPQIVRNVFRGCRHPLSQRYVLIMSITRLCIPLYFYGYEDNFIGHETTHWIWILVIYVSLQVLILFLQDTFGPRFFVPSMYLPQTYDYHPILSTAEDEESIAANKDCAICMLPIDMHHGHSSLNVVLSRTNYMVTPCHHIFHTECLEKWMRIKLECPVCRAYLPAC